MQTTYEIPFIQYLLPNGRQQSTSIPMSQVEWDQYLKVRDSGCNMAVEMLSDYTMVSLTIEDRANEQDFDIEVVPNGPEVPKAISRMLARFSVEALTKAREEWNNA